MSRALAGEVLFAVSGVITLGKSTQKLVPAAIRLLTLTDCTAGVYLRGYIPLTVYQECVWGMLMRMSSPPRFYVLNAVVLGHSRS